ncbi:MAG: NAD(P)/FAD-dependent oxidoreductase, partial [Treponema sp.]|nr:NAD(P)/FAD-dependent oxidoreductase [Treponema sp.]
MKKIVILGAGYAGVLAAKKLAKKTKKNRDVDITIIDKNPFHTMLTELHEVAAQRVEEDSIRINLERIFAGRRVNVVHDNITQIDFENRQINGQHDAYTYDYLVLGAGSKPAFFGVGGAKDHSFTLWSYEDAVRLREHIELMFRKAAAEADIGKKREFLTFYVVGAGFTGVEMAGELAELVPVLCRRYEIDKTLVTMVDVDMLDRVCTVLPEKQSAKVVRRLEKTGVKVMLKTNIKGVGEDYIEYDTGSGLERQKTYTVIWTAGVEGAQITQDSASLGAAGRGRVQTDEYLRSQNDKNVYVVGDNIFYIPEGEKAPVSQMVENAENS